MKFRQRQFVIHGYNLIFKSFFTERKLFLDIKDHRWDHPFIRVSYNDHGFARGERSFMEPQYLVDESPYMMQPYSLEYRK